MPELRLEVPAASSMEALGRRLGALLRRGDLVVLSGELGAGKTTLTRGIGEGMGVRGPITSPTFVLSRVHPSIGGAGIPLVHVDAYRLGSARELDDLDLDFDGAAVVVEWGEGLLDGVAESWLELRIDRSQASPVDAPAEDDELVNDPRTVTVAGHGPRWASLEGLA